MSLFPLDFVTWWNLTFLRSAKPRTLQAFLASLRWWELLLLAHAQLSSLSGPSPECLVTGPSVDGTTRLWEYYQNQRGKEFWQTAPKCYKAVILPKPFWMAFAVPAPGSTHVPASSSQHTRTSCMHIEEFEAGVLFQADLNPLKFWFHS